MRAQNEAGHLARVSYLRIEVQAACGYTDNPTLAAFPPQKEETFRGYHSEREREGARARETFTVLKKQGLFEGPVGNIMVPGNFSFKE